MLIIIAPTVFRTLSSRLLHREYFDSYRVANAPPHDIDSFGRDSFVIINLKLIE